MLTKFKSNRLGEILVRKGIITHEQLKVAIHEQNHRRKTLHPTHSLVRQSTCLGEILTELGFINRAQLKRGLNWQLILRKITMALALCAPLMGAGYAKAATKTISGIPATIQSELFSTAVGVKNEVTTDIGGGFNTGAIHAGDWMNYLNNQVNITIKGEYIVSYRVSSLRGGGSFLFNEVGTSVTKIDTVSVPKTGGWQTWITIQRKVNLRAGTHFFNIQALTGGFNLNWFSITSLAGSSTTPATGTATSSKVSVASSAAVSSQSNSSVTAVKSSAQASSNISSSSAPAAVSSSKASSTASSKSSSQSSVASSKSSASSSKSASSIDPNYSHVVGPLGLAWLAPKQREDKTALDITELGGYQLRYKSLATSKYVYITINDPWATTYNFTWLEGDYVFEIAAFDKLGMLSDFSSFTSE